MTEEERITLIDDYIGNSREVLYHLPPREINEAAKLIIKTFRSGHKLFLIGNGGSAADAQHIAAELVGHYHTEREPLPAIALTTDTSALTAIGNDYGYENVFYRQLAALGNEGDCLLAISTSGNSVNVITAMLYAKENGIAVIGLTGEKDGGTMAMSASSGTPIRFEDLCDICIKVPSDYTPIIQQAHITIGHLICELIDQSYGES